jgi:PAS domain S-box-containing protein
MTGRSVTVREQRYKRIFEESPIGIAVIGGDDRFLEVNQAYCRMLGYSRSELTGMSFLDITDPEYRKSEIHLVQKLGSLNTPLRKLRKRLRKKSGDVAIVTGTAFLIGDELGSSARAIELVEAASELKAPEEHVNLLSKAVQQICEGIAVTDMQGKLILVNQAFAEMHGYRPEELLGKDLFFLRAPDDMQNLATAKRKFMRTGEFRGEVRHVRSDGRVFPGSVHSSVLRDEQKRPIGTAHALRDITDMKKAEEALRTTNARLADYLQSLEAKARERTQHLEDARRQVEQSAARMEQANDALKVLISGIEEQKRSVEKRIAENIQSVTRPLLDQIKAEDLPDRIRSLVNSLERNLDEITTTLRPNIMKYGQLLTLREMRICEMIMSGLTSKEIAKAMGVSPQTISFHRSNIRKKLGLTGNEDDLANCLKSMT